MCYYWIAIKMEDQIHRRSEVMNDILRLGPIYYNVT